jgi:hypothetical protein
VDETVCSRTAKSLHEPESSEIEKNVLVNRAYHRMLDLHNFQKCQPVLCTQEMRISNIKKNGVDFRFKLVLFLTVKAVYTLRVRVNGDKGGQPNGVYECNKRRDVKVLDSDGQILYWLLGNRYTPTYSPQETVSSSSTSQTAGSGSFGT